MKRVEFAEDPFLKIAKETLVENSDAHRELYDDAGAQAAFDTS